MGRNKLEKYGFTGIELETELAEHIDYEKHVDENEVKLNNEQLIAYQDILNSVINKEGKLYFLDAPAEKEKRFLLTYYYQN